MINVNPPQNGLDRIREARGKGSRGGAQRGRGRDDRENPFFQDQDGWWVRDGNMEFAGEWVKEEGVWYFDRDDGTAYYTEDGVKHSNRKR